MTDQLTNKSRNPFYNSLTVETVRNSKFRRTDVFNERIVTLLVDQLEAEARTI